jgi:hypothetical protein
MASAGMRSTPAPRVSLGTKWLAECETSTVMVCAARETENRDKGKNGGQNLHANASKANKIDYCNDRIIADWPTCHPPQFQPFVKSARSPGGISVSSPMSLIRAAPSPGQFHVSPVREEPIWATSQSPTPPLDEVQDLWQLGREDLR